MRSLRLTHRQWSEIQDLVTTLEHQQVAAHTERDNSVSEREDPPCRNRMWGLFSHVIPSAPPYLLCNPVSAVGCPHPTLHNRWPEYGNWPLICRSRHFLSSSWCDGSCWEEQRSGRLWMWWALQPALTPSSQRPSAVSPLPQWQCAWTCYFPLSLKCKGVFLRDHCTEEGSCLNKKARNALQAEERHRWR